MRKVYLATREELNNIVTSGNVDDGTPVGRVVFDYILRDGYVKANGATVADASVNYPRLVAFLQANADSTLAVNVAAWEANKVLYFYDETNDELTLPDYTGLMLQGATVVNEITAGLPDIYGYHSGPIAFGSDGVYQANGAFNKSSIFSSNTSVAWGSYNTQHNNIMMFSHIRFYASSSNEIYGRSQTVQPHAAGLIPQIRY